MGSARSAARVQRSGGAQRQRPDGAEDRRLARGYGEWLGARGWTRLRAATLLDPTLLWLLLLVLLMMRLLMLLLLVMLLVFRMVAEGAKMSESRSKEE